MELSPELILGVTLVVALLATTATWTARAKPEDRKWGFGIIIALFGILVSLVGMSRRPGKVDQSGGDTTPPPAPAPDRPSVAPTEDETRTTDEHADKTDEMLGELLEEPAGDPPADEPDPGVVDFLRGRKDG